jgi:hypothetical protein
VTGSEEFWIVEEEGPEPNQGAASSSADTLTSPDSPDSPDSAESASKATSEGPSSTEAELEVEESITYKYVVLTLSLPPSGDSNAVQSFMASLSTMFSETVSEIEFLSSTLNPSIHPTVTVRLSLKVDAEDAAVVSKLLSGSAFTSSLRAFFLPSTNDITKAATVVEVSVVDTAPVKVNVVHPLSHSGNPDPNPTPETENGTPVNHHPGKVMLRHVIYGVGAFFFVLCVGGIIALVMRNQSRNHTLDVTLDSQCGKQKVLGSKDMMAFPPRGTSVYGVDADAYGKKPLLYDFSRNDEASIV